MMFRYDRKEDYISMWDEDKKSILTIMYRNMTSDLEAGYDVNGKSIRQQMEDIDSYRNKYYDEMEKLIAMEESAANRWCFMDMKRRGVIE